MKLQDMTWQEVGGADRECVVVIPTGSLEQHGPHLPLFTDSLIVTAVAEAVEARLGEKMLLTPTLWLGASGHHLKFPGSLSNGFEAYMGAIQAVVESLIPHGFHKFHVLNGHGGNNEPNGVAIRTLKARYPNYTFGHAGYFGLIAKDVASVLEGPIKEMRHACEAEASLMLHLQPSLVRGHLLRDDGLVADPPVSSVTHHFDEVTEDGSYGYATLASAEKGRMIFEAAVKAVETEIGTIARGYILRGITSKR